jgi:formate dehydrogenase maturation protein FdhE
MSKDFEIPPDIDILKEPHKCPHCGEEDVEPHFSHLTTIIGKRYCVFWLECPKCETEWEEYFVYEGFIYKKYCNHSW